MIKVYTQRNSNSPNSKKGNKSRSMVINGLRIRSNSVSRKQNEMFPRASVESNALDDPTEPFDFFYKLIIIGDAYVGKTNFLLRCARGYYESRPKQTQGVEFLFKTQDLPNSNQKVRA